MAILSRFFTWSSSSKSSTSAANPTAASNLSSTNITVHHETIKSQSSAKRRLQKEFIRVRVDPPTHCSCGPIGDDIFRWQGAIMGPSNTPFDGGIFFLSIEIPFNYPFKPPKIKFRTKVYHPNIDGDGTIHINILGDEWTPALNIEKLLLSICSFLPDPNAEDRRNLVCNLYRNERTRYDRIAREWTKKYAMG